MGVGTSLFKFDLDIYYNFFFRQLHLDSATKMSYAASKICFEMLNSTLKNAFTNSWGYKDKDGNWTGVVEFMIKKKADLGRYE